MNATLTQSLLDAGLSRQAHALAALAMPSARMRVALSPDTEIPLGASKLGGSPDMPALFEWPSWNGDPLAFVGQMSLGAANQLAGISPRLPAHGLLSFFYHPEQTAWGFDPKDRGSAQVFWFNEPQKLMRTAPPARLPSHGRFEAGRAELHEYLSLAPDSSIAVQALRLSPEEKDAYFQFGLGWSDAAGAGPAHQLLGHPLVIQDEMQLEVQLAASGLYVGDASGYEDSRAEALGSGAAEWQLLAQIDTHDDIGMMWGDGGMLYFWIRGSDLAARRFDRTWLVLQCM